MASINLGYRANTMRRLPPLGALRAFEAAARHLSFTRAAAELCVTQAAISHQVRQLEDWLGLKLFARRGHALTLTVEGGSYLSELTHLFDGLAEATARLSGRSEDTLRITALPSFASRWLLPRLGGFRAQHPEIELKLTTSTTLWAHTDDSFDIGIRSGLGRWPGLKADLIAREYLSPVCSPALREPLEAPTDLRHATLLHDEPKGAWRAWFEHAGAAPPRRTSGVVFNDAGMVLQAAVEGQGVALGRLLLAADDLAAGRLVQPFDVSMPNDFSYWLVYPRASAGRPEVAAFRAWLLAEARGNA
ncbi:transcriptional regulator GcvA [Ralstonia flaminis]|jgi:LysR family glycine cleavage system transcriptional activator|uniref:Glycine cleavage system transcriptional activator n=1 Tax=Ralstonia flaminis TaxID=3058597 RepID=A0ABM9K3Y7_9RALS|nr:transcriptional regulator GcvA [Ralstonia sp. LMG 18101]CAJ0812316.1 Glycine cleavage system transcriptional activator [Ralstonia sp. LMG 18101]